CRYRVSADRKTGRSERRRRTTEGCCTQHRRAVHELHGASYSARYRCCEVDRLTIVRWVRRRGQRDIRQPVLPQSGLVYRESTVDEGDHIVARVQACDRYRISPGWRSWCSSRRVDWHACDCCRVSITVHECARDAIAERWIPFSVCAACIGYRNRQSRCAAWSGSRADG